MPRQFCQFVGQGIEEVCMVQINLLRSLLCKLITVVYSNEVEDFE